ncbi:MAG: hypothetical protein JWR01_2734 [Subtercola sp.]|nr:hypothetical protein [Subtercola sp.]
MQKSSVRPNYSIESVDNALRLIQVLRDEGSLRLTEASNYLGVANSTAHRLLAMLVYRGFAIRNDDHAYVAGPSIAPSSSTASENRELRMLLYPHLELLSSRVRTTVTLMTRIGVSVRMLSTIEDQYLTRIGDRRGEVFPARSTACGKALLANVSDRTIHSLYRSPAAEQSGDYLEAHDFSELMKELDRVRDNGYATSNAESEPGIGAIGMALRGTEDRVVAAFSVLVPIDEIRESAPETTLALMRFARTDMIRAFTAP